MFLNNGKTLCAFDVQFPISVNMPDGSQITIGNEDELFDAVESLL
jgi:hypothetical protein